MNRSTKVQKKGAVIAELEAVLIKHIRATGGLSRIELAHELALSPSTVGTYVDRLIGEGYLVEGKKVQSGIGRPRTLIKLNSAAGQFVGVDFHADEMLAVAVDFAQNVVRQTSRPIRPGDTADTVVQGIVSMIDAIVPGSQEHLLGIGIGTPGPVDRDTGLALDYRYIKGFKNVPLVAPVAARFKAPVYIENAANAMALAELWFGQGRGLNSFACIWIRSGIGAGIIVDRRLYSGLGDGAGEIGFWYCPVYAAARTGVLAASEQVPVRDLEEIASVRAIRASLADGLRAGQSSSLGSDPEQLNTDRIVQAYREGDSLARDVIDAAARSLGWAIAHLAFGLAPERIILAGPLAALGDDFLECLQRIVADRFAGSGLQLPPITMSEMGPFGGALGAAALCVDQWKPVRN